MHFVVNLCLTVQSGFDMMPAVYSTVAQRQSGRLLTGRFLVRIQAVELAAAP